MKLVPMRFCLYTWHHNPKSIKIISDKDVVNLCSPYQKHFSKDFGENLRIVSGVGELYGENCLEEYAKAVDLYDADIVCAGYNRVSRKKSVQNPVAETCKKRLLGICRRFLDK